MKKQSYRRALMGLALIGAMSCAVVSRGDMSRGGLPNLEAPTLGGSQFWADVAWSDGWRVQRHVWTRHHRLLDSSNVRRAWGAGKYCESLLPNETNEEHLVILLHGLGRTRNSLSEMQCELESEGYRVASLSYPSTRGTLDEHAKCVERVLGRLEGVERVSFVTHSLGGRVVLQLLEREGEWMDRIELGRIVQIAPPNGGSGLAAQLEDVPFLACLLGPAFLEVGDSRSPTPELDVDVGVLAGGSGSPIGWNPFLPGDDDGVVAVSETRLDFPHDHLAVSEVHTFLMNDEDVIAATKRYLASGTLE